MNDSRERERVRERREGGRVDHWVERKWKRKAGFYFKGSPYTSFIIASRCVVFFRYREEDI